jgi:hypothetical protein
VEHVASPQDADGGGDAVDGAHNVFAVFSTRNTNFINCLDIFYHRFFIYCYNKKRRYYF